MKTIIKYELVINEALRSALNYHTPDEQINEFIRFFGRHIGSDRIYIFEDCKERHGTDNTYEWCAEGVIPEIYCAMHQSACFSDFPYEPSRIIRISTFLLFSLYSIVKLPRCKKACPTQAIQCGIKRK